jgi:2'-5' RNA ligase
MPSFYQIGAIMKVMKRIFIAIELPGEIKQKLVEVQNKLNLPQAKLVKLEAMHLTLVFLGNVDEEKIKIAVEELKKDLADFGKFEVTIKDLGCFPNSTRAHTIWIGLDGAQKLTQLESKIRERLRLMKFKLEDRPFVPHLTLARLRQKIDLSDSMKKYQNFKADKFNVSEIIIFESQLSPKGSKHIPLYTIKLE